MNGTSAARLKVVTGTTAGKTLFPIAAVGASSTVVGPSSSTGIDINTLKGRSGDLLAVITGLGGATAGAIDAKVTESATTNGTYTDITGASITQIAANANVDWGACIRIPVNGRLGFIRLSVSGGAGASGSTVGAVLLYEGSENLPVQ